jgi:hypothetical protein
MSGHMNTLVASSRLCLLLMASASVSCSHVNFQSDSLTRKDAENAMARIQRGMTLQDVRRVLPQTAEEMVFVSHGGMILAFRLDHRYSILVRFAHPPEGRPDAQLIAEPNKYIRFYERSCVNHSPSLNEDGKVISEPGRPW